VSGCSDSRRGRGSSGEAETWGGREAGGEKLEVEEGEGKRAAQKVGVAELGPCGPGITNRRSEFTVLCTTSRSDTSTAPSETLRCIHTTVSLEMHR
jgi:hypothetical protein